MQFELQIPSYSSKRKVGHEQKERYNSEEGKVRNEKTMTQEKQQNPGKGQKVNDVTGQDQRCGSSHEQAALLPAVQIPNQGRGPRALSVLGGTLQFLRARRTSLGCHFGMSQLLRPSPHLGSTLFFLSPFISTFHTSHLLNVPSSTSTMVRSLNIT